VALAFAGLPKAKPLITNTQEQTIRNGKIVATLISISVPYLACCKEFMLLFLGPSSIAAVLCQPLQQWNVTSNIAGVNWLV
jgi:hypothetical protein